MKASELRLHHGFLSLGCQCTTKNWLRIVILQAITATQHDEFDWSTKHFPMSSRTGALEPGTQCSCIGEGKFCGNQRCIWLPLWLIILNWTNLRGEVSTQHQNAKFNITRNNRLKCLGGCHRCECPSKSYLDTDTHFRSKSTARVKKTVMAAAAGIPGAGRPVVQFCHNGRQHTEGPAVRDYEREHRRSGFHLFFSTFWMISTFCLFQMHMRDSLHQIDHGVIIHVLRAILRLFYGNNMF